jgi:hypothetical protein
MLARAGRRYVRHLWQAADTQVLVVLLEIDDPFEALRIADEARIAEQRHARGLRVRTRVVVLDVELPGHATLVEPVENGGLVTGAVRRLG